jgi:cytidine deaminase
MCRQVFVEFAGAGALEIVSVTRDGARAQWRLAELAPAPFDQNSLAHHT